MKPDDALYTAESIVAQRKFPTRLSDPQVYVDSILASQWWMNKYPTWGQIDKPNRTSVRRTVGCAIKSTKQ